MNEPLRDPKTPMATLVRELAEAAMSVTHHDIDSREPEAILEIEAMERRFRPLIAAYIRRSRRPPRVT